MKVKLAQPERTHPHIPASRRLTVRSDDAVVCLIIGSNLCRAAWRTRCSGVVRCAFFDRDLPSRSAIEFHAFAPRETLRHACDQMAFLSGFHYLVPVPL
jgi:hypothetical protein